MKGFVVLYGQPWGPRADVTPRFRAEDTGLAHVLSSREGTGLAQPFSCPKLSPIREQRSLPDAWCGNPSHWVSPIPHNVISCNRGGEGVGVSLGH